MDHDKDAVTDHAILELLQHRWSPRSFAPTPIDRETLLRLFEAARWAPSSFNEQPWRFIVASKEDAAEFDRLLQCLSEGNRRWASAATVLVLSVAKLYFERTRKPNRHAMHDVGLATATLVIQATALGVSVHQMAGFDVEAARRTYSIPDGFEPATAWALGYPGSPDLLDETQRTRELAPRSRLPISSWLFKGQWGEPF